MSAFHAHSAKACLEWASNAVVGPDSSVGIATRYRLDGPGIQFVGGDIFRTRSERSWGASSLLYRGYQVFLEGKAAGAWC